MKLDSVGMYFQDIKNYPILSEEETIVLFERIRKGDIEAKDWFIKCNLKLVVSIAKRNKTTRLSFEDLIQEGNLGLLRAVEKFDITKGYRFSTYAAIWIRSFMQRAIQEKGSLIHVPRDKMDIMKKILDLIYEEKAKTNKNLTKEEIAKTLDEDVSLVEDLIFISKIPISIDAPINDDTEKTFVDLMPSDREDIDDLLDNLLFEFIYKKAEEVLSERDMEIIKLHFGFSGEPISFEEIGKLYGISKPGAHQVKNRALIKLKRAIKHLV